MEALVYQFIISNVVSVLIAIFWVLNLRLMYRIHSPKSRDTAEWVRGYNEAFRHLTEHERQTQQGEK